MELKKHCPYYNPDCPICHTQSWIEELKRIVGDLNVADDFIPSREQVEFDVLKSFISSQIEKAYNQGKQDGIKSIGLERKVDLDLSPGFNITAEYRLGEIRGYNQAVQDLENLKNLKLKE